MNETELLRIITEIAAPSGQEQKRAEYISNLIRQYGYRPQVDEVGNVLIPLTVNESESYALMMAHLDTVFSDQEIHVKQNGSIMSAPGIGDDTSNVVQLLKYLDFMKREPVRLKRNLLFAFNVCEEGTGNLKGIRQIMKDYHGMISEVVSFDLMSDFICMKAVGSIRYQVKVSSPGGHSYHAFGQTGAIETAAEMINHIYQIKIPEQTGSKSTYNVGMIHGGTSVNTIAQNCEFLVEIRSDEKTSLDNLNEQLKSIFHMFDSDETGIKIMYALIGDRPTGDVIDDVAQKRLIQRASEAIESNTGIRPELKSGSTDCNLPLSLGIPAISFGAYLGGGAHTREEWIDTEFMETGFNIIKDFMSYYIESII